MFVKERIPQRFEDYHLPLYIWLLILSFQVEQMQIPEGFLQIYNEGW
jgi:hypothetical protein